MDNYSKASINHCVIKLFKVSGSVETPVLVDETQVSRDLSNAQLDEAVVFGQLLPNSTYRIRSYAYKAAGTAEADLISTADVSSYTDVTLTTNDHPTLTSLRVKLIDVVFNGQATASAVTVTSGGYTTSGPETMQ